VPVLRQSEIEQGHRCCQPETLMFGVLIGLETFSLSVFSQVSDTSHHVPMMESAAHARLDS
jgi:hypothetical protein